MIGKKKLIKRIEELEERFENATNRIDMLELEGSATSFDYGKLTFCSFMFKFRNIFRAELRKCQQPEAADSDDDTVNTVGTGEIACGSVTIEDIDRIIDMLDIDEVKAKILIGIAYDIWRSSPLKQTGTVLDKNGELILYSVDFRGLLAENSGSLTACIFCQRVTDADKPKVMLYAKHKAEQAVVLSEDEKQLIYENICRAGFIRQR